MNTATTAGQTKTWQRTRTPGLLRHRSGRYYARFTLAGKTRFAALKTDLAEFARVRFAEERPRRKRTRKAARKTAGGIATMDDRRDPASVRLSHPPMESELARFRRCA
jgi:hypothetical protein